jgi:uncharacterized membrane protein YoaK (UPF0700 family)
MTTEGTVTLVCAVISATVSGAIGVGWHRYTIVALLAFSMGIRNSVVRRLAVPEVTTTVLTMTLTGLAADSFLAGGSNPHTTRRASAVLSMLAGAFIGAVMFLHIGPTWPLVTAGVGVLAAMVVYGSLDRRAGLGRADQ